MNLSDYINLTLEEIAKGAQMATETYQKLGAGCVLAETSMHIEGIPYVKKIGIKGQDTNKPIIKVTFHVGLEVGESMESNGKVGGSIKVLSADAGTQNYDGKKQIQEITFDMPVLLPSVRK